MQPRAKRTFAHRDAQKTAIGDASVGLRNAANDRCSSFSHLAIAGCMAHDRVLFLFFYFRRHRFCVRARASRKMRNTKGERSFSRSSAAIHFRVDATLRRCRQRVDLRAIQLASSGDKRARARPLIALSCGRSNFDRIFRQFESCFCRCRRCFSHLPLLLRTFTVEWKLAFAC